MAQIAKHWCFTLNNYSPEDVEAWKSWPITYGVVGKEVGAAQETPHLQGYIVLENKSRLSALKKLNGRAHWAVCKGTPAQNRAYCTKEHDFQEIGTFPKTAGARTQERWTLARRAAEEGRWADIPDDLYIKYFGNLQKIHSQAKVTLVECEGTTGIWIYGPPGSGKSRMAREIAPGAYIKMQNKWWDGYQGEEDVILDDFDTDKMGHYLKIWTDRYPFRAEVKGGSLMARPKRIIITANYHPSELFEGAMLAAIERRCQIIFKDIKKEDGTDPEVSQSPSEAPADATCQSDPASQEEPANAGLPEEVCSTCESVSHGQGSDEVARDSAVFQVCQEVNGGYEVSEFPDISCVRPDSVGFGLSADVFLESPRN